MKYFLKTIIFIAVCALISSSVNAETVTKVFLGSKGQMVVDLQTSLKNMGLYIGPIDGSFGRGTQAAVIAYQKQNNLVADGIAGPRTLTKALGRSVVPSEIALVENIKNGVSGTLSEAEFTKLCNDGRKRVQILSPNGGESLTTGDDITISWRSCNMKSSELLNIWIVQKVSGLSGDSALFKNIPNTGSLSTVIPTTTNQEPFRFIGKEIFPKRSGQNVYSIVINKPKDDTVVDFSDSTLTVSRKKPAQRKVTLLNGKQFTVPKGFVYDSNGVNEFFVKDPAIYEPMLEGYIDPAIFYINEVITDVQARYEKYGIDGSGFAGCTKAYKGMLCYPRRDEVSYDLAQDLIEIYRSTER